MSVRVFFGISLGVVVFVVSPTMVFAHRSGCHTLHTCSSDSNSYVCGDLGYPCNGVSRIADIDPATVFVPLLVESTFKEYFGRVPTEAESSYWKARFRSDKNSIHKIRGAMDWHRANGSFGPAGSSFDVPSVPDVTVVSSSDIATLFSSVHEGRLPTVTERAYWVARILDKPTRPALVGAMNWHKTHGISHL